MFKTIATKLAALRARFNAWRANRNPRHAAPADDLGTKRTARKIERGLKKAAVTVVAVGLTALLVLNPPAFMGLVVIGCYGYAAWWLVASWSVILDAVV